MKFHKGRRSKRGRIEIIPMIDVMFFLLATFILASLTMQNIHSLGINLPEGAVPPTPENTGVTLTIKKDSAMLLNDTPVTLADLSTKLEPMLKGKDNRIIVAADNATPQGMVVQAMLQARRAGVEHFMIAVMSNNPD
ncbi:ExbD/TolR family protein [Candidatus Magnetominusculus xianensis]|uniref:Biopolymer transporter ExbD n=1 Tax=Candidatus Magnetominusculus xianensis TaxID=1748249 RepID=A0ABR5SH93_9BACT|nr:biopolymer transporter ExbD [Candidatus Magnetominusculus xianensis]KWT86925.1 biopolymer transporter ExbD [Candidatus Magnetominusculus xianensis]MBF0403951.1 biopolymer transporter ExbD [Nitrospirota bacterium]